MKEDIYISTLVRLGTKTTIKPQTGMLCWGKIKDNSQSSKTKLHQLMSIKENHEPGPLTINYIFKVNKQGRCPIFILNTTSSLCSLVCTVLFKNRFLSSECLEKIYKMSSFKCWEPFLTNAPNFTKCDTPDELKNTKQIPVRHLRMTVYKMKRTDK